MTEKHHVNIFRDSDNDIELNTVETDNGTIVFKLKYRGLLEETNSSMKELIRLSDIPFWAKNRITSQLPAFFN